MIISDSDLASIEKLCVLENTGVGLKKDLSHILEYVKCLNEVDTTNVVPTSYSFHRVNITRPDEALKQTSFQHTDCSFEACTIPSIIAEH